MLSPFFSDKEVIRTSERFVRLIIRRPHAYWFKQRYTKAPIPGFVFMSPKGQVFDTYPLLLPGQTLEKFRTVLKAYAQGKAAKETKATSTEKQMRATFLVPGMKKTASGAT